MRHRTRMSFEELVAQNKNQILNDKNELERIDKILDKKISEEGDKASENLK
ncbi:FbpB family small basic protein [Ferdinandcohnia sp. SAFN-114]|uniref:FbpB family small basic protein n=1 Tax=Ferdinandcohnia sp. SAFN-114 TaxID=3387275 RepID=UPI003F7D6606